MSTNPIGQTFDAGGTVSFTAAATGGNPAPTVQWNVSTAGATAFTPISGATSTTYSFTATSAANGSQYEAVFTNSAGTVTSNPATLIVDYGPAVITNPTGQAINTGSTATFTATASGNPTATVQWEVSSSGATAFTPISGATSTTYSFATSSTDNGNQYEAVFSNGIGTAATTTPAALTVYYAPAVVTDPITQTINTGATVTFTATASGNPTPTVQWEVSSSGATGFTAISGATSTTYSFATSSADNGNQYEAVFTNTNGSTPTTAAKLTVQAGPAVTQDPSSQTISAGALVSFTASVTADPDATVQWEVSTSGATAFTPITGATSTTYSFATTSADNGNHYEAVFSGDAGTVTSTPATLTVGYAPTVTAQPANQTVNTGGTATFKATASGSPTPSVQWDVSTSGASGFSAISGATSTTYSFATSSADNGSQYEAVFSNGIGTAATSTAVTLTVDYVSTEPAEQALTANSTATFTAASSNPGGADTVQWEVSTSGATAFSPITGATSTTYSLTATSAVNGNQYEAVFTNSFGSFTSSPATLTLATAPAVTTSPSSQTVNAGSAATFTATASASPAATVQWEVSTSGATAFTTILGATSTSYSVAASSTDNGSQYEAVFTNVAGAATSNPVTLTVDYLTTEPLSQSVNTGTTATFTATTSNAGGADKVQWQVSTDGGFSFTPVSGATSTTYSFTTANTQSGNEYKAVFTNSAGTFTSTPATLTVDYAPAMITQPASHTVNTGSTGTFTAAASGNPAPTVQWEVSSGGGTAFSPISGATSTTYTFTASLADNGSEYEAVFTNAAGTVTSTLATLSVQTAMTLTSSPSNQTVTSGNTASFTASASGTPTPTVQWDVSTSGASAFTPISGATSSTYSLTAASADNGSQYEAIFSDSYGTLTTTPATLTVDFAPTVTSTPSSETAGAGGTVTFTAAASANPAATVQWEVSTSGATAFSAISGATSTTYSFTAASTDSGNQYEAVFSNGIGSSAKTAPATLTVFSVTANQATLDLSDDTVASFAITNGVATDSYKYTVTSSGGSGTVTGSGTLSFTSQQVDNVNVSSLPSGTLTYSVTLTSTGGITSEAATTTATLTSLTVTPPPTSATVNALYSYQVQTNAPSGDTITVTPGTLPSSIQYNATTQTFSMTPAAALAGTTVSYTATITDSYGNSRTLGPVYVEVAAAGGLTAIAPPTNIAIGSPVLVALDSTNAGTPAFTATTSSSSDPSGADLTATFLPQTNQVLQIVTNLGTMDFQLFNNYTPNTVAHFVNLVNSDTYTKTTFYRIIEDFMSQGGVGSSYTGPAISTIPDELNADLRFTSSGLLAMANDGADGNSSEFFITNPDDTSDGFLDFRYTIFGKLISGDNVRQAIAATPVTTNTSTHEDSKPLTAPQIESMSIVTETSDSVLMLTAATGATGTYTVKVSDGQGGTESFTITIGTNAYDPPNPWVQPINGTDTIQVAANGSVTFTPQGESADGTTPQVNVQLFRAIPADAGWYVDNSYELIDGTFELQVGSTTTGSITFNSDNLAGTAANIQSA